MNLEKEFEKRQKGIADSERELTKKEIVSIKRLKRVNVTLKKLKEKNKILDKEKAQTQIERGKLMERQNDISEKLEKVAGMTKAKAELVSVMEEEAKLDAAKMIARIEEEANEDAEKRAKRVLGIRSSKICWRVCCGTKITSVELPGDEIKGRLIGREGRNIRAFDLWR